jgi:outer membrane protein assembly factor BamB
MRAITRLTLILTLAVSAAAPRPVSADDPAPSLLPLDVAWTRPFPFGGSFGLVPSDSRLLVILPQQVDAYAWKADGAPLWSAALAVTAPPVVSDGRVFLAGAEQIQAVSEVSGFVEWRLPTGSVSVAPTAHAGWVIVPSDDRRLRAVSASDGRVIWQDTLPAGLTAPMAIDGDLLVGAFDDGVIRGWNITDGRVRWATPTGTRPTQLLASFGQVFLTGENGRLISLQRRNGRVAWSYRLDMPVAGRIASDAGHVYVTTIDNSVRAHDYRGHQVWRQSVAGRIVDGLFADGGRVFVPQSDGEIRIFLADAGTRAGRLAAPAGNAIATGGLKTSGSGATLRLALTRAEPSARSVTTYQRTGLPVTVATRATGTPVPLAPPGPPGRQ